MGRRVKSICRYRELRRPLAPFDIPFASARPQTAKRASLLAGTALASTLLLSSLLVPAPAKAASCTQLPSPAPISDLNINDFIICVNTEPRTNPAGNAIELSTIGDDLDPSVTLRTL